MISKAEDTAISTQKASQRCYKLSTEFQASVDTTPAPFPEPINVSFLDKFKYWCKGTIFSHFEMIYSGDSKHSKSCSPQEMLTCSVEGCFTARPMEIWEGRDLIVAIEQSWDEDAGPPRGMSWCSFAQNLHFFPFSYPSLVFLACHSFSK